MTKPNAEPTLTNDFNFMLPVYNNAGTDIVQRLWFLDTGEADCDGVIGFGCVQTDQVDWFREQNSNIPDTDPSKGNGFLFMHIPMVEYVHLYNSYDYFGTAKQEVLC